MVETDGAPLVRCAHDRCLSMVHWQANLASLSKSDIGDLFVNIIPGLPQIHRLCLNISAASSGPRVARKAINKNAPDYSLAEQAAIIKSLSTRIAGSKVLS